MTPRSDLAHLISAALIALAITGCSGDSQNKVVFGTVTCGGQRVEVGRVRFVPVDETTGPASVAAIIDGQYRIEARGGIPIGRHRVEIVAQRKTGRMVPNVAVADGMTEELERISADPYAGEHSPLIIEIDSGSDGRLDLEVPRRSDIPTRGIPETRETRHPRITIVMRECA